MWVGARPAGVSRDAESAAGRPKFAMGPLALVLGAPGPPRKYQRPLNHSCPLARPRNPGIYRVLPCLDPGPAALPPQPDSLGTGRPHAAPRPAKTAPGAGIALPRHVRTKTGGIAPRRREAFRRSNLIACPITGIHLPSAAPRQSRCARQWPMFCRPYPASRGPARARFAPPAGPMPARCVPRPAGAIWAATDAPGALPSQLPRFAIVLLGAAMKRQRVGPRRRRHPLAKVKGGWSEEEDGVLIS